MQRLFLLVIFAAMTAASTASIAQATSSVDIDQSQVATGDAGEAGGDVSQVQVAQVIQTDGEIDDPATGEVDSPASTDGSYTVSSTRLQSCTSTTHTFTNYDYNVLVKVNQYRANRGLARLCVRTQLLQSSRYWSDYMRDCYCFGHGDFSARMDYFYPAMDASCENIAYWTRGSLSAGELVQLWHNSDSHRECLQYPWLREFGFSAKTNSAHDVTFGTLDMGRNY